ncbi:apolipoprotein D [Bicyclus anynana]|uniref:Apolipoprotein D n=1 Tax=Bicyclus anynana TaxID=110368 RepID=A0A6J1N0Y4_BICAN|nr:apolipoprotein D [Bicyclus anynana]
MCKKYISFLLLLNLHVSCLGQVILFGDCKEVKTMEYFEIERFLGQWYTIQRIPSWYEENGQCSYKLVQQCERSIVFQHRSIRGGIEYMFHINSTYAPGDEAVFVIPKNNIDPFGIPLSVLRTDYTNYAIVYGCKYNQMLNFKYVLTWILSRSTTLPPDILDTAYEELYPLPGGLGYMERVDHSPELCDYHWTAHVQAVYKNDTDTNP